MISENPSVKFELISQNDNQMTVTELCEIARVSRSGYYRWVDAAPERAEREQADQADFELVLGAYQKRGYTKGARGIYMCLLHRDPMVIMNLKKIRRLMGKYGLMCPVRKANPYRRMAKALKTSNAAQYLPDRKFSVTPPISSYHYMESGLNQIGRRNNGQRQPVSKASDAFPLISVSLLYIIVLCISIENAGTKSAIYI